MKFPVLFSLVLVFTYGCNNNNVQAKLLSEQKLLKDSANNINDRIAAYLDRGHNDSAEAEKLRLAPVFARLIAIQSSLDSLAKGQ